jgi:hypothetical protein
MRIGMGACVEIPPALSRLDLCKLIAHRSICKDGWVTQGDSDFTRTPLAQKIPQNGHTRLTYFVRCCATMHPNLSSDR